MTFSRRLLPNPRPLQLITGGFAVLAGTLVVLRQDAPHPLFQTAGTIGYAVAALVSFAAWFGLGRPALAGPARRLVIGFHLPFVPVQFLFLLTHQVAWLGMLMSTVAVVAMRPRFPRLGRTSRKVWLTLHVGLSVGWLGVSLVMFVLALIGATTGSAELRPAAYHFMETFNLWLAIPSVFATLVTGIVLALGTPWGLVRHVWVLAKLVIALSLPVLAAFEGGWIETLAVETRDPAYDTGAMGWWLVGFMGLFFALLWSATILSVLKPFGRTRWGRRSVVSRQGHVTVTRTTTVAEGVVELELTEAEGRELPAWAPGAHVDLVLPSGRVRQYSLCGSPSDRSSYTVAVKDEPGGRGGSAEVHALPPGASIGMRGPRNHFELVDAPAYLLVAGGIGVAPMLPIAAELERRGAEWQLVYRGHSRATMAFAVELASAYPQRVRISAADQEPRPDLGALLSSAPPGTAVYACGPTTMLDALEELAPAGRLHTERFTPRERTDDAANTAFEAELRRTGRTVQVPIDRSLLAVLQDVDPTLDFSCEDGICGSCETRVLAGTPDHRDDVLQPAERRRTDVMYPCVSRARGTRIVLDL